MEATGYTLFFFLGNDCTQIETNHLMLKEDLHQMSVYLYEYA